MSTTTRALAHVRPDGAVHGLAEHLLAVGELAKSFADPFGGSAQAELAGLWHDLGKYAADFQTMLSSALAASERSEAHVEKLEEPGGKRRVDHSTAGAFHVARRDGTHGLPLAFAIAGHHAGLADWPQLLERFEDCGEARLEAALAESPPSNILTRDVPSLSARLLPLAKRDVDAWRRLEIFTRMIFSALCDADFLDTEAFFDAARPVLLRGGHKSVAELAPRLRAHVDRLTKRDTEVNRVRAEVRAACVTAASNAPGLYTLTVPTGGGKTFAAMEFALDHALRNDLRRVVVAIPYTSIIEQNAGKYREAFGLEDGDVSVLEHHSSLDPATETARSRVACENWDAPVVVTTNVQLLESLFANRPGACRKLHRLARSIIVLDEAQTLPRGLLAPTTSMLEALVTEYGCTVVLCTATQPALGRNVLGDCGFSATSEIVPDPHALAARLRRVDVDWSRAETEVAWAELGVEIAQHGDVLTIVHQRKDARSLCDGVDAALGDRSTVHLSALMCPAHRKLVLDEIRARKQRGEAVRVVATQLVEAGVDLDFPVVYRAMAGLDSLAQAAGRCNREGRLLGRGQLRVFLAPTSPPPGILVQGLAIAQTMLRANPTLDLFAPATHSDYFARLYAAGGIGSRDEKGIESHRAQLDFKTVAASYRVVDDAWSAPVVVPFDERARKAIAAVERLGPSRDRLRQLQRVTVSVSCRDRDACVRSGLVRVIGDDTAYVLAATGSYDSRFGLATEFTLASADSVV
ncbi:MAG TPA: CRISPR-associated endonuclease Cas3'' [Kofleriaceae bacterium]